MNDDGKGNDWVELQVQRRRDAGPMPRLDLCPECVQELNGFLGEPWRLTS
jgi:hypothetical protein